MEPIKVSIIVPVYGVENFIERCARSLFEQTMDKGVEFIFVNDCTKDRSIEILEKIIEEYPQRKPYIKIIHHKINTKLAGARNTGLDNACGEFVSMVDSDDYLNINMVKTLYNKAIVSEADIVFSNFLYQYQNKAIKYHIKKRNSKGEYLVDILDRTSPTNWWGRIYKRSLIEDNGIRINPDMENFGEDYSTVPKIFFFAKKVEFVEEYLYHYVQFNPNAFTKDVNPKQINRIVATLKIVDDFFKDKDKIYKEAIEKGKIMANLAHAFNFKGITLQKKGFNTFPNVNYQNFYSQLNRYYKIVYLLASNNLFWLLNILTGIYKKVKLMI